MKFTHIDLKETAEKEYKIYSYLNAINNSTVEAYGIPSIYYYGTWKDHVMMAMTLLDAPLDKKMKQQQLNEVDLMIVFQQVVSTILERGRSSYCISFGFQFFLLSLECFTGANNKIHS